ncbi:MAG TPA: formylmethanofuran dehydrogenase subunit C [Isosphaeraceae bacterium]|jgi:formylmethanofuran dehydrogenase subunit C|nr:formylmethanofuran dehydrogenase subunit C [Isosphaeraceae bacterium]
MPLTLRPIGRSTLPIDADDLNPDRLAGRAAAEVARISVRVGNTRAEVGELFEVEGDLADDHLVFEGDLRHVHRIGAGLRTGTITVRGDAGARVGAGMEGGTIVVSGDIGDWAGAGMKEGLLRIQGSTGDHLGASEPGEVLGMRGGAILVAGSIGHGAGLAMRRGLIAVAGAAGDDLGRAMVAGSIFAFGPVGDRSGAGMKRGTLALLGPTPRLLPTFRPAGRFRPHVLTIYLRWLRDRGFSVPAEAFRGDVSRYNGDRVEHGQGEVWLW